MKRRNFLWFAAALGLSLAGGWALQPQRPLTAQPPLAAQRQTILLVSVAASLQDVMQVIQADFEQAHPEIALNYNFGSSGALQQQIEQGAPVDIFISAGVPQMDALETQGLLQAGSRHDLLGNRLVLIAPNDSTLGLSDFSDLTQASVERISVGEFRSVPAGQYAEQVFTSLDILAALQPKLIFANNVRGVLAAVESGNVDAGVVYATDAAISDRVTVVAIAAADLHKPITYPLAILDDAANPEAAQTFVEYLVSDAARAVFEDFGFTVLD
ncbi:molybdate ABC transporter substrate-binding protein [Leptolyngbya sp. KIOST-1]|uniref:molybdate ABC transporter substrate-binding protein n=1 Tax=Leptolyngbya sp. KIOST-1 TaxID=1229172 RepID=UPI0005665308|nr:molybdate ABC transporter substrate-binding protein [Leptolyngbya sp. KIOST-1]